MKLIIIVSFFFIYTIEALEAPCPQSVSLPLEKAEHQKILYEDYYNDRETVLSCVCELTRPCIRKCCEMHQVLTDTIDPQCISRVNNKTTPDLLPNDNQLASEELKNISGMSQHFKIIHNRFCPNGTFRLEPERYKEDNFMLFANGSLFALQQWLPQWRYCMDWLEDVSVIAVLLCHIPEPEEIVAETAIYPFGFAISIPFLLATLVVYSIIPELRNLYGITLMCYVACLIAAYGFLAGGQLIYHGQSLCIVVAESRAIDMCLIILTVVLLMLVSCVITVQFAEDFDSPLYPTPVELPQTSSISTEYLSEAKIPICCAPQHFLRASKCHKDEARVPGDVTIPVVYVMPKQKSKKMFNDFIPRYGIPCMHGLYALNPNPPSLDVFYLLENSSIYQDNSRYHLPDTLLTAVDYCFANIIRAELNASTVVAACMPWRKAKTVPIIYPIMMFMSSIFLAVTLLVYSLLPELKNIHGLTLMAYVSCLFAAYAALTVVQFKPSLAHDAKGLCVALGCCWQFRLMIVPFTVTAIIAKHIIVQIYGMEISCRQLPERAMLLNVNALVYLLCITGVLSTDVLNQAHCLHHAELIPISTAATQTQSSDDLTYCPCDEKICLPLCCPRGHKMSRGTCLPMQPQHDAIDLPQIYDAQSFQPQNSSAKVYFYQSMDPEVYLFQFDPCPGTIKYHLDPDSDGNHTSEFFFLSNGSIYFPDIEYTLDDTESYCFAPNARGNKTLAIWLCPETADFDERNFSKVLPIGMIVSLPFLLITFIVYAVVPELKNIHGFVLRCYVFNLFIAYLALAVALMVWFSEPKLCILMAFVIHFSFLASFFWLNVMCFDIWWTFGKNPRKVINRDNGGFRSLQGSIKQREMKKFVIYSVYAWGCAAFFTGICLVMDLVPGIPDTLIKPGFGHSNCWFSTNTARAIYFYAPMAVTIVCNISLFISTTMKILQHKKDTAHHLKGMDSHRHDDSRQWFNLYLKLFIVMGISWSMEIISWLCQGTPQYVWYVTDLANTLQGVIIFIIFVWKPKIKRLLLKRFKRDGPGFGFRASTKSAGYSSTTSRTYTSALMPLQDIKITNHNFDKNLSTTAVVTDESECL